jgi:hypothetical protein
LSSKPSREPASRHDESKPEPKSSANQPAPDTNKLPFAQPNFIRTSIDVSDIEGTRPQVQA